MLKDFSSLPDEARVWLFAADADLDGDTAGALLEPVRAYVDGWTSHGRPVDAAAEILERRVLAVAGVISADELNAGVSGCGIDAMTRAVEAAAGSAGVRWMGGLDVAYRADGAWRVVSRQEFRWLARDGVVTPRTPVLDVTPPVLGDLRAQGVARPAGEAWHGEVFWGSGKRVSG